MNKFLAVLLCSTVISGTATVALAKHRRCRPRERAGKICMRVVPRSRQPRRLPQRHRRIGIGGGQRLNGAHWARRQPPAVSFSIGLKRVL